jgi:hypothetical protein
MVQMLDGQAGPIAPQTDAETTEALKELGYIE